MSDTPHIPNIDIRENEPARGQQQTKEVPAITKAAAIEYDRGSENAPKVTASGKGFIAEQIIALAFERGIKVRTITIRNMIHTNPTAAYAHTVRCISLDCMARMVRCALPSNPPE